MPNPFDQFDEPGTTATATANPFDQFDTSPQADPRAARRADLQAQQAAARSAGETTSFSARAAAGIEQGLRTPEAMVRGGLDALQYYRALDAVTGSGDRFQRQNEAELRAMRDRDAFLARETQAIEGRDGRNFVGDLVQGVARGVVELPPQLMAGAAGAMRGAAVQASAAMGGVQGGLSQYAQERGEGRSQLEALPPAVASGLITAVTTRRFGDTGIESVFRNEGVQGVRSGLLQVFKQAGLEGAEEFVDQVQQDLLERATRNPGKPFGESVYDSLLALGVGTVIGGAATAPRLIQRGNRPVIVNEQTGTTDFPPLEGDELPPPPPPAPPAGPANVPPPIRGEAAMETRPSASWTPDGPRTPAVDPELADAIAAIRAGYNPEVDAPALSAPAPNLDPDPALQTLSPTPSAPTTATRGPTGAPAPVADVPRAGESLSPAAPSTFNLQPSTLPDVPGVPLPLEGQPYDTALRTRPEATMESRPAAPLGLQREPTVSPELAEAIAAVRGGYNPEVDSSNAASQAASVTSPANEDYRGTHRAPSGDNGEGSLNAMNRTYPDDLYSKDGARLYGDTTDVARDRQMHRIIVDAKGKPDKLVTVYRAVPKGTGGKINPGDWVTPSKAYALEHGARFDEGTDILEAKVKAGDLFTEGNSIYEFGWSPKSSPEPTPPDQSGGPTELTPPAKAKAKAPKAAAPSAVDSAIAATDPFPKEWALEQRGYRAEKLSGGVHVVTYLITHRRKDVGLVMFENKGDHYVTRDMKVDAAHRGKGLAQQIVSRFSRLGFQVRSTTHTSPSAAKMWQRLGAAKEGDRYVLRPPPDQSGGPTELTPPAKGKAPKAAAPSAVDSAIAGPETTAPAAGNPFDTGRTGRRLTELRETRPRPLDKYFGSKGGTPDERAAHEAQIRQWNKEYRKAQAAHKLEVERSNDWLRSQPNPSAIDSAIAALESAKVKPGGLYALPDLGLTVTLWNGTLTAAQVALRAGRTLAQAVQAGVDWLRAQGQAFDEAEVRKALEQGLLQAPGIREHVGKRLLQEDFSPAAKAALEPLLRYEVKPDAQLFAEAAAVVEAIGPMEAEANYFGNPWGLPADAHVVLGFAIGNGLSTLETQARAAGDTALADRIGRQNAEFQSQFVLQSTETARTLRAYRYFDLVGNLSPFTADLFARKVIERASQKQKQRLKPTLDAAQQQLTDINRAGINEAARTPEVQGAARTAINQTIEEEAERKDTAVERAITLEVSNTLETLPSVVRKANAAVLGAWDKLSAGEQVRQQTGRAGQGLENSLWSAVKQRGGTASTVSSVIAQVNRALHEQMNRALGITPQQFVNPTTYLMRLRDALGNAEVMSRIWEQTRAAVGANLAAIGEMEGLLVRIEAEIAELEAEAKTPLAGGPEVTAKDAKLKAQQQAARDEMLKGRNANLADAIKQRRDRIADVTAQLAEYRKMQPAWQAVMGMTVDVWGPNLLRGLLREQMKADGFRLRKAVADHFRGLAGAPDPLKSLGVLRDKLIAASGLDPQAAERLAKDLEAEYTAQVNKERARLTERLAKARERRANLEENAPRREAEALIDGYQKAQTEWLKPEGQKSAIRQIIRQAMADPTAAKHRDEQAFRADLATRFEGVRVPPGAAARLAYEVWLAKQARDASAVAKKRAAGEKAEAERDQKSADALLDTWEREQTEWLRPSARQGVSAAVAKVLRTAGLTETQFQAAIQSAVGGFNVTANTVGEIALAGWRKYQTLEANRRTKEAAKTRDKAVTDAESLIDAYERRQTEWLKPTGRKSAVRAIVRQALREGASVAGLNEQVVRGGVQAQLEAVGVPHEAAYRLAYEVWQERQAKGGGIEAVVAARVKELQLDLGRIIRQHWTQVDKAGESLAEHIVGETKMPAEQAERLAAAIQRRFKALVQARKEQALRNLAKTPAARELQKPSVAQRIIEATNLGALDSEGLWQAVADKLGLPTYSAEASAEVKRLADRAQQLPEGSVQRQEATARLMRFIARQKNVNLGDLGWAFWYANTLSGPFTHAVNAFSNVLSLAGNVSTQFRDVRGIPQILAATAKGFRTGLTEARAIVKQGPGANRTKFTEQGQALENLDPQDFTGAGLVSQWRYVARALAAADAAFYFPAREAKAITLARALARQEGKTGAAIRTRAQQILDGTEEQQNLWGAQVDRERAQLVAMGEKPDALWTTRRLEQLREQGWGADIGEAADDFALRTTYNNRPYGLIGTLADVAKFAQNRVPGARGVVPFVNVVANVVNDSINYTPWGFARAYAAGRTGEPSVTLSLPFEWAEKLREGKSPMTPDAVVDLHAKAALGTAMVGSLMAMALAGLDDDDGENFQLYGSGPKDAAAKAALRETGWLPYSVRVNGKYFSFANTPLAIPLGALGHYLDAARYDKRFEQADAFNRLGVALWGGAHIITQQSFLDGLARLLGALEERRGRIDTASDRAVEQAFRSISSVAVPNALRQLDRLNDPKIYDARGIEGALVAAIPFARRAGSPALNAFGEPITNEPWKRFASDAEANVWTDLARRKIYPSVADKAKNSNGREMTDDEHYRYVQESGQAIKRRLETPGMRQMIRAGKEEDARRAVTAIVREERERARRRLGF